MRYTDNPWLEDSKDKVKRVRNRPSQHDHQRHNKPKKKKAKPTSNLVVVDEPKPPHGAYAPLDHELTESSVSKPSDNSFAKGCLFGVLIVVGIIVFSCWLLTQAFAPVLQSFAELTFSLNNLFN